MKPLPLPVALLLALLPHAGFAQQPDEPPPPPAWPPPATANPAYGKPRPPLWRDTTRYRHLGVGRATRHGQIVAYALQIYDLCDNKLVANDFVKSRLEWFSTFTERTETCDSLLDYLGVRPRDPNNPDDISPLAFPEAEPPP